jgi:hypothetical protein
MSVNNQPTNLNFLSPTGYKLLLSRAPTVEFMVQRVSLPTLTLPVTYQPNPFVAIPRPGDHLEFGQLSVTFKVNENLDNYLEIYNWMIALGKPEQYSQYTLKDRPYQDASEQKQTVASDITLTFLTSAMNGNLEFTMRDCFPISLTDLEVDSTVSDVEYITASATFALRDYTINKI